MAKSYTLKCKWIVKVFTLLFILCFNKSWGQATIPVTRDVWSTTPAGWTDGQGGTPTYASDICAGADGTSGRLDNTGEYFILNYNAGASALSFCMAGSGGSATSSFDVDESIDGTTWTNVANYASVSTTASTRNLTLNCSSRYVRFIFTTKTANNIKIDAVSLTKGTCCTAPTIAITPVTQTGCAGSPVTLTVTNSATIPSYTWQASTNGSTGWADVVAGTPAGASYSGLNTSTLSITPGSTYYYHCLVAENNTCTATSAISTLSVNTAPTITLQPTNKTICSGKNTTFKVDDTGSPTTYQWQEKVPAGSFVNITNGGVYTGATTGTLTLTNVPTSMNTYSYQCILTVAGCTTATTSIATLSVNASPPASPAPVPLANPACENTYLTAVTSTVAGVTWYWESTSAAGSSTASPSSSNYYVGVSGIYYLGARDNTNGCFTTTGTSVTVNLNPIVTSQPTDISICSGANTSFAVTASNVTGYLWQLDNGGGFVNLSNGAPYSNVTTNALTITGAIAGMTGYKYRCIISGSAPCATVASNFGTLTISAAIAPVTAASALTTSNIGCNAFNLSFTKGSGSNRLVVVKSGSAVAGTPTDGTNYSANTVFGSGGIIAAGEFVVYAGSGSSVFITGLSASTTYFYKVFEFNGCNYKYLTSGTVPSGSQLTTTCANPAGITGVYIDACGSGTCPSEGSNELIWGTTGSYGMAVNNNGPTLHYNSTTAPVTTYISSYSQNASNITVLNNAVGVCGTTTFVDPNTQGYIPPNSKFLIANNCMCSPSVYDFSGLCGAGPIYVVFGTNSQWPCNTSGGIFGNYTLGGGVRYFDLDMSSWGTALDPIYNYTIGSLSGSGDGDIVLTNPVGGAATTYSNSACKVPLIILPIELLDFYATKNNKGNDVIWKVAQEENILYYKIEKSKDAIEFNEFATVYATNDIHTKSYSVFDNEPYHDITYYRLSTKETNGPTKNYKIISVNEVDNKWEYIHYQTENNLVLEFKNALPKNSVVSLFDVSGKELITQAIKQSQTMINTDGLTLGVYFVRLSTPYKTEYFKIIISN